MKMECPNCKVLQEELRRMVEQHRKLLHPRSYEEVPEKTGCRLPELYCQDPNCETHGK